MFAMRSRLIAAGCSHRQVLHIPVSSSPSTSKKPTCTHARVSSFLGETQVRATDLSKMSSDIFGTRARSEEESHFLQDNFRLKYCTESHSARQMNM